MKPCEQCTTVQPYGNGIWRCMVCRKEYVPIDQIEEAEPQKPVRPYIVQKPVSQMESMLREDYSTQGDKR